MFILFTLGLLTVAYSFLAGLISFRRFSVTRSVERVSASIRTASFAGGFIYGFALLCRGALALPVAKPSSLAHPMSLCLLPSTESVAAFLCSGSYPRSSFGPSARSGGLWPRLGGSGRPFWRPSVSLGAFLGPAGVHGSVITWTGVPRVAL